MKSWIAMAGWTGMKAKLFLCASLAFAVLSVGSNWSCRSPSVSSGNGTASEAIAKEKRGAEMARAISAADEHVCVVYYNGVLKCWDLANKTHRVNRGRNFRNVDTAMQIVGGLGKRGHYCALDDECEMSCWEEEGEGDRLLAPDEEFRELSVGDSFTCAIAKDSSLACWGDNSSTQIDAPAGRFRSLDSGTLHSCAIQSDSEVYCWGGNDRGQADAPAGKFVEISAGNAFSCGVRDNGRITCWGLNNSGQIEAPGGTFVDVSAGSDLACGIRLDGSLDCWGGFPVDPTVPPGEFREIVVGTRGLICGITELREAKCWGLELNDEGDTELKIRNLD